MAKGTLLIAAIVAMVTLVGTVGLNVVATDGDSGGQGGNFLRHLHELGHRLHGGEHHHDHMAGLIEQLELTPDQLRRLEKVHEIIGTFGGGETRSMADLHDELVAQFERGHLETEEIRSAIDGHVEQMREMAYAATDELIALINGLDDRQREVLLAHLRGH